MTEPNNLRTGWWSFQLPGYRNHPALATYSKFAFEDLPPINEQLDERYSWLDTPTYGDASLANGENGNGEKPDLSALAEFLRQPNLHLPEAFVTFMRSKELQNRIRSCTDNYLELPDFLVRTVGNDPGTLIHFLADSQVVFRWYLFVGDDGAEFVLCSPEPFGFYYENADLHEINLEAQPVWYCAHSFIEFIYRFWIENEIWFKRRPVTTRELAYVAHYTQRK